MALLCLATIQGISWTIWRGGSITGGDHTFWIQETANLVQSYELEFVFDATPVPVPAAAWLFLSAFGVLTGFRRFTNENSVVRK